MEAPSLEITYPENRAIDQKLGLTELDLSKVIPERKPKLSLTKGKWSPAAIVTGIVVGGIGLMATGWLVFRSFSNSKPATG
jgi:hypothetical protein